MKSKILTFFMLFTLNIMAQEVDKKITYIDSLYREDQFYVNITYNSLKNSPARVAQGGFSPGLSFGFLRDFPVNKNRNLAFATGFGFAMLGINQNLIATDIDGNVSYEVKDEKEFERNRLSLFMIEAPIEFRWRTSTPETHKFWRIYGGFKASYIFYNKLRYTAATGSNTLKNNADVQKLQLSTYITFGFNTWNFYMLYGISPLYQSKVQIDNNPVKMGMLNLGLQFYIL